MLNFVNMWLIPNNMYMLTINILIWTNQITPKQPIQQNT